MELGNESCYKENGKNIKYLASEPLADGAFGSLCDALDQAVKELKSYCSGGNTKKDILEGLKKKVNDAQLAVTSISVRAVSQQEAQIEKEFATLLSIIMTKSIAREVTCGLSKPCQMDHIILIGHGNMVCRTKNSDHGHLDP
ncbi:hypothetical protein AX15_005974 [Amanita polypyramis BW_CC]|nr:hypothetical protein AX15_005974 [Amanita polypyramis BW_CC]